MLMQVHLVGGTYAAWVPWMALYEVLKSSPKLEELKDWMANAVRVESGGALALHRSATLARFWLALRHVADSLVVVLALFQIFDERLAGPIDERLAGPIGESSTAPFTQDEWDRFSKLLASCLVGQALKVKNLEFVDRPQEGSEFDSEFGDGSQLLMSEATDL